uniref:Sialidase-1 n=1 Tax=Nothoprocta perdicaria TaxID=30464 RepID=A0A8C6ZG85_NOTPE
MAAGGSPRGRGPPGGTKWPINGFFPHFCACFSAPPLFGRCPFKSRPRPRGGGGGARGGHVTAALKGAAPKMAALVALLALAAAARAWVATPDTVRPHIVQEQLLWTAGSGSVAAFRIPLLLRAGPRALLACAEGRKVSAGDAGAKFIACRRSSDDGATWGPSRFVADDGAAGDGLSLGAAVAAGGGRLLLLFARGAHGAAPETFVLRSPDGGRSWGPPHNLTGLLGGRLFAPGPGYGIQVRAEGPRRPGGRDGVSCLLSDDGGASWRLGGTLRALPYGAPARPFDFTPDECQPYELPDGSLAINIRNQNFFRCRCRMVARSWDGGESLPPGAVTFDPVLVDPAVAAGVAVTAGLVFFSNPAHESRRSSRSHGDPWGQEGLQVGL